VLFLLLLLLLEDAHRADRCGGCCWVAVRRLVVDAFRRVKWAYALPSESPARYLIVIKFIGGPRATGWETCNEEESGGGFARFSVLGVEYKEVNH